MNLITCPDCNHSISRSAKSCPSCGAKLARPPSNMAILARLVGLVVAGLIVLLALAYMGGE